MLSLAQRWLPIVKNINEIRDLTTDFLTEVYNDVCIEPKLQPLTGEALTGVTSNAQDGARFDIATNGFWEASLKEHFWTFVCSIHVPPPTNNQTLSSATET